MANHGIFVQELTEDEKFVKFERWMNYKARRRIKHEIVHDEEKNDIGIALSRNGREGFRKYEKRICYWYTGPYAYVVTNPIGGKKFTVDLSKLV